MAWLMEAIKYAGLQVILSGIDYRRGLCGITQFSAHPGALLAGARPTG